MRWHELAQQQGYNMLTFRLVILDNNYNNLSLMARPDNSLSVMLMADREKNEPFAGAVLLRALPFLSQRFNPARLLTPPVRQSNGRGGGSIFPTPFGEPAVIQYFSQLHN
jgi:hypothetical protein